MRLFLSLLWIAAFSQSLFADSRPNVLWFVVDDMSPCFSCYGETVIQTPNVDRLAAEGTRFDRAYVTAPVCSPCRSALITGMVQTSIGAHQHRSGRGELKIHLPSSVVPVPILFQKAGYFTCIGNGLAANDSSSKTKKNGKTRKAANVVALGKTDYNFEWDKEMYDSHDWADRQSDQPFFMQVQLSGGKLREGSPQARKNFQERVVAEFGKATDPLRVALPRYYPRDQVLLDDWALFLDAVRMTDAHVGQVIARLERENLLDNTLVIFITDHGISHARGKQFLYDEGTRIPMVVRGPGIPKNSVRKDLVQQIDLSAISLAAGGIPTPSNMHGKNIFADNYVSRSTIFAARDRCDETVERIRSVRTERFLYIKNFFPMRPHLQPNAYKDGKAILQRLRTLHTDGLLDAVQEKLLFSPTRPTEELYEYAVDREQLTNLADTPNYRVELEKHRELLEEWIIESGDQGFESEAMYDSDMVEYLKKPNASVEANIATMKKWAKEGK